MGTLGIQHNINKRQNFKQFPEYISKSITCDLRSQSFKLHFSLEPITITILSCKIHKTVIETLIHP